MIASGRLVTSIEVPMKRLQPSIWCRKLCSSAKDGTQVKHAEVKAFVIGTFAGGLGSLIGLGGAFIVIPFLNGPMQLSQHMTHGTSMATVVATSIGACANYAYHVWKKRNEPVVPGTENDGINFTAAALVAITAGFAARRGAILSKKMTDRQLKVAMGLFTLSVAPLVHVKDYLKGVGSVSTAAPVSDLGAGQVAAVSLGAGGVPSMYSSLRTVLVARLESVLPADALGHMEGSAQMLGVGLMSGYLAGVFGVGGGAVTVPALVLFTDMPYRAALLTSLAAMVPTALSGALQHHKQGTMVLRLAWPMGLGALMGAVVGTNMVQYTDEHSLRYVFTGIMGSLGARSLWQAARMVR